MTHVQLVSLIFSCLLCQILLFNLQLSISSLSALATTATSIRRHKRDINAQQAVGRLRTLAASRFQNTSLNLTSTLLTPPAFRGFSETSTFIALVAKTSVYQDVSAEQLTKPSYIASSSEIQRRSTFLLTNNFSPASPASPSEHGDVQKAAKQESAQNAARGPLKGTQRDRRAQSWRADFTSQGHAQWLPRSYFYFELLLVLPTHTPSYPLHDRCPS